MTSLIANNYRVNQHHLLMTFGIYLEELAMRCLMAKGVSTDKLAFAYAPNLFAGIYYLFCGLLEFAECLLSKRMPSTNKVVPSLNDYSII
ncbi:hypothetical protein H2O73_04150 [Vibrio sp. 404]|uniref:Uncharacterized protein n=1 Tax=Vibrio marinisediminis TaxID=2758441 RepID=A0A7W2ISP2_9VIBR|nr:hypothetical protein [Vibrio marinisediminis]MBA5761529.1 hypothetical protein [Vibrio marinisediminis]